LWCKRKKPKNKPRVKTVVDVTCPPLPAEGHVIDEISHVVVQSSMVRDRGYEYSYAFTPLQMALVVHVSCGTSSGRGLEILVLRLIALLRP
jgi:hypothetical protein